MKRDPLKTKRRLRMEAAEAVAKPAPKAPAAKKAPKKPAQG